MPIYEITRDEITSIPRTNFAATGLSERNDLQRLGDPPDKQEKATQTVLEQAEVLSQMWAA